MATQTPKQISVLTLSTLAFTACFAILMMVPMFGATIKRIPSLNETEFGILVATSVLTGSLVRLSLGRRTNKLG